MATRRNVVEEKGLQEQVLTLRFQGKTLKEISQTLKVPFNSVQVFLARQKENKIISEKAELLPPISNKSEMLVEITQEIAKQKLGQIVGEAEKNYLKFSDDKTKDDNKAAYWFGQYQSAVEKLLRASGQYERARRLAEQEEPKKVVIEVIHTRGKS